MLSIRSQELVWMSIFQSDGYYTPSALEFDTVHQRGFDFFGSSPPVPVRLAEG